MDLLSCSLSPPASPGCRGCEESPAPKILCLWPEQMDVEYDDVEADDVEADVRLVTPICDCRTARFSQEYCLNLVHPEELPGTRKLVDFEGKLLGLVSDCMNFVEDMHANPFSDIREAGHINARSNINISVAQLKIALLGCLSKDCAKVYLRCCGPPLQALLLSIGRLSYPKPSQINSVTFPMTYLLNLFPTMIFFQFHKLFLGGTKEHNTFQLFFQFLLSQFIWLIIETRAASIEDSYVLIEPNSSIFPCPCFHQHFSLLLSLTNAVKAPALPAIIKILQKLLNGDNKEITDTGNCAVLSNSKLFTKICPELCIDIIRTVLDCKLNGLSYVNTLSEEQSDVLNDNLLLICKNGGFTNNILVELIKLQKVSPLRLDMTNEIIDLFLNQAGQIALDEGSCILDALDVVPVSKSQWTSSLNGLIQDNPTTQTKQYQLLIRIIKDKVEHSDIGWLNRLLMRIRVKVDRLVLNSRFTHHLLSLLLLISHTKPIPSYVQRVCDVVSYLQDKCLETTCEGIRARSLFLLAASLLSLKNEAAYGILKKACDKMLKQSHNQAILALFREYTSECIDLLSSTTKPFSNELINLCIFNWECIRENERIQFFEAALPLLNIVTAHLICRESVSNRMISVNNFLSCGLCDKYILGMIVRSEKHDKDIFLANLLVLDFEINQMNAIQRLRTIISFNSNSNILNNLGLLISLCRKSEGANLLRLLDSDLVALWYSCVLITPPYDQMYAQLNEICAIVQTCPSVTKVRDKEMNGYKDDSLSVLDDLLRALKNGANAELSNQLTNKWFTNSVGLVSPIILKIGNTPIQLLTFESLQQFRICEHAVKVIGKLLLNCCSYLYKKGDNRSFLYKVHSVLIFRRTDVSPVSTYLSKLLLPEYFKGIFSMSSWHKDLLLIRMAFKETAREFMPELPCNSENPFLAMIDASFDGSSFIRINLWRHLFAEVDLKACEQIGDVHPKRDRKKQLVAFNTFFKTVSTTDKLSHFEREESISLVLLFLRLLTHPNCLKDKGERSGLLVETGQNLARILKNVEDYDRFESIPGLILQKDEKQLFLLLVAFSLLIDKEVLPVSFLASIIGSIKNVLDTIANVSLRSAVQRKCDDLLNKLKR